MVIPPLASTQSGTGFYHGGSAEFAAPDHQGILEHVPLLEVGDQRRTGLIDGAALFLTLPSTSECLSHCGRAGKRVPRSTRRRASRQWLAKLAGHPRYRSAFVVWLSLEKSINSGPCLHAIGHFIGLDARFDFWISQLLVESSLSDSRRQGLPLGPDRCLWGSRCRRGSPPSEGNPWCSDGRNPTPQKAPPLRLPPS